MATPSVGTFPSAFASTTPAYPLPSSSSTLSSSSSSSFSSAAFAPRAPPPKIPAPPSASRPAVVGRYSALVALIFDAILATGADPPPSEPQFADPTGYSTSNTITLSAFASSLRRRIVRAQSSPNALDDVEIDPDEDVPLIMAILLRERVLLPHPSLRIPALFALFTLFRNAHVSLINHPFLSVFLEYIEPSFVALHPALAASHLPQFHLQQSSTLYPPYTHPAGAADASVIAVSPAECYLVCLLLNDRAKEVSENTVSDLLNSPTMTTDSHQLLSDPKMAVKLFGIRKDLHDLNGRTCLHSNGVLALEDDDGKREEGGLPTVDEARAAAMAVFDLAPGESLEDLFHAQLPLYVPEPPLPSFRPQLQWIDPPLSLHVLMVDVHGQKEQAERELAKSYMDIAFHRQLTDQQFQTVAGFFDRDPLFLHDCGLSQDAFLLLVEHNPNLAVGVTLRLVGSTKINDYLKALITAPLTLHTVEVVNRLATETDLPEEFLPLYVSGCIQGCDKVTDPAMQARQVRLVCLFLQSLLRNGAISLADFSVEIEAFCVQFSRIKEAAGLFQLIKQQ